MLYCYNHFNSIIHNDQRAIFIVADLPIEIKRYIIDLAKTLQREFPFQTWHPFEKYHVTMWYSGKCTPQQEVNALQQVRNFVSQASPFELSFTNLGTFDPCSPNPKVLYLGVQRNKQLINLRKNIYENIPTCGPAFNANPYNPHISLAFNYTGEEPFNYNKLSDFSGFWLDEMPVTSWRVNELHAYTSVGGAYQSIATLPFGI